MMDTTMGWLSATPIPSEAKRAKDPDWERKQRLREYRVAARREKRNRKADEKKQRKLNATILRRMTRNPEKYTKNADRNRLRAIHDERHRIYAHAVKQAQRLASIYDPSGVTFNVGAVITQDDGTIISVEAVRRREERQAAKQASRSQGEVVIQSGAEGNGQQSDIVQIDTINQDSNARRLVSKAQRKRMALHEPRPLPPKPVIPNGISLPEGEENWLELCDASDEQIERRIAREKKQKAAERKALRQRQQMFKIERRAARDEKRKVYRDLKLTWKSIKEEQTKYKTLLKAAEDEEAKKIAVEINDVERVAALAKCAEFGFTMSNVPEVAHIKPRALGMKGVEVDFDALHLTRESNESKVKLKNRVDLSRISSDARTETIPTTHETSEDVEEEFIKIDIGEGADYKAMSYNHKLRRKLRRAIEAAEIEKETIVREHTCASLRERGLPTPSLLTTSPKPIHLRGQRALENGLLEIDKGERVRLRLELAEYNKAARVLRKQAKQIAMEAGLRTYAELTGKLPDCKREHYPDFEKEYGPGWYKP